MLRNQKIDVILQLEKPLDGKLRYGRPLVTPMVFLLLFKYCDTILNHFPRFLFDSQ